MSVYVDSTATGAGDGTSWTDAYTTLVLALAANGNGTVYWVNAAHAETQAANMVMAFSNVRDNPDTVLCVVEATPPTALSTAGKITTTGNTFMETNGNKLKRKKKKACF